MRRGSVDARMAPGYRHSSSVAKTPTQRTKPEQRRPAAVAAQPRVHPGVVAALAAFVVMLVRTAWVSDDTYITYRVIDNFLNGYGLTWNVDERVQAYTHPLWLFMNAAVMAFTREVYMTGIAVSIVVSLVALALFAFLVAVTPRAALLGMLALLFSHAFVDYSTSGLENPLTHLLLALFLIFWFRTPHDLGRAYRLGAVAALGFLTRADFILLVAPAFIVALLALPRRSAVKALLVALAPVLVWEAFSLVYYGSLLPNTAYAKLNTGIQRSELVRQGIYYLIDSLQRDPLTLVATVGAMVAALVAKRKEQIPIVVGMAATLFYVVWIGGDFMGGRFLTATLFTAIALLSQFRFDDRRAFAVVAAGVVLLGCVLARPTIASGRNFGLDRRTMYHGIADERAFYFQQTGLLRADGKHGVDDHPKAVEGRSARSHNWSVQLGGMVGFLGYYSGPQAHILDGYALADPLLARLPERGITWMVGHFAREVPLGYMNSLLHRKNMIEDPRIAKFYDALRVITRDPLFSGKRWGEIWKMNTGAYDELLEPFFEARRLQEDAVRELAGGRPEACIAAASRAAELDPRRAAAWALIARASLVTGDLERAQSSAVEAATILPSVHASDVMAVGAAYEARGDSASAIVVYETLLTVDPKHATAREHLSRLRVTPPGE